ncbi:MAG: hypothetical protein K2L82_03495 [Lachnospiraceae bacterium]|nr:hypothetical protein [Lachnospiraceae bacterium]
MKRYHYKKIIAAAMSLMMTASLLGGCGKGGQHSDDGNGPNGNPAADGTSQSGGVSAEGTAMGRYLEEITDMSDKLQNYNGNLFVLQDGELVITEVMNDIYSSNDCGKTWEVKELEWLDDLYEQGKYVNDYAFGPDGTVGVICSPMDRGTEEGTEDENFSQLPEDNLLFFADYQAMIIRPDGTQVAVNLPQGEEMSPQHIWIAGDGTVFVGTDGDKLYEIAEDGSGKVYLNLENAPQLIQFQGNYMIIDGWYYNDLLIYDMETKEYVEDAVLSDFMKENYGNRDFNGGSFYDLFFFTGEDDVLYLAGKQGVHRHVIGGSAMEQIIDANLSTFGDPSYRVRGMAAMDNNEFVALFTGSRLVRYTYDPTVPTVPSESVKAYSLRENTMLRKAIALYQTAHPEVYVEYEIGIEGGSVTKEDALKKLNTEIMAGEGPDLLILDDIPTDSYIEKGLFKDLSPLVDSLDGDDILFDNIVDAFRQDDGLYMIPCEANLPTMLGKEKYISQMTDLEGIADGMEEMRRDNPQKDLLRLCSPKAIMRNFIPASAPAWMKPSGEIDREAVKEFYIQTKRIYDAQMDGLAEEAIEDYRQRDEEQVQYFAERLEDMDFFDYAMDEYYYLRGARQILAGALGYAYSYAELTSVRRVKGFEEDIIIPMNGLCDNVFCASTLASINASSGNIEHAEGLLKALLGKDGVTALGFPVNQAAFEKELYPDDYVSSEESYSTHGYMDEDGSMFTWEIYWFDEKTADELRQRMKTVDTPYVKNEVLEEAVLDAGVSYINGECGLDEAVADVEKSMSIYLAE